MTATLSFLKTLKIITGKKLRGIRDSMPQGYLLGRSSSGNGPPELIAMDSLLAGIKSTVGGIAANPTATASDTVANGTATTFMRSDAAPAVQKTSSTLFGLAKVDGTSITAAGGVISTLNNGTVTSVGLTMPAEFTVTGSPVVTAGTLAVSKATQAANTFYAGPASGAAAAPTFRTWSVNDPSGWGFAAGSIPFMTATGIAQNNSNFFWDNTNLRLGIGNAVPGSLIDAKGITAVITITDTSGAQNPFFLGNFSINGSSQFTANRDPRTGNSPNVNAAQAAIVMKTGNGDSNISIQTSNVNGNISTAAIFIDKNSNVGIGNLLPVIALDVGGPIGAKVYTVAALPSATIRSGQFAFVSDATLTAITGLGLAPTGGGTNFVPVYSDGAGWKII